MGLVLREVVLSGSNLINFIISGKNPVFKWSPLAQNTFPPGAVPTCPFLLLILIPERLQCTGTEWLRNRWKIWKASQHLPWWRDYGKPEQGKTKGSNAEFEWFAAKFWIIWNWGGRLVWDVEPVKHSRGTGSGEPLEGVWNEGGQVWNLAENQLWASPEPLRFLFLNVLLISFLFRNPSFCQKAWEKKMGNRGKTGKNRK